MECDCNSYYREVALVSCPGFGVLDSGCEIETSEKVVSMPVTLAGRQGRGIIKASVVRGHAPLLISRSALKTQDPRRFTGLGKDSLRLFGNDVPLQVNQAGQYVVKLTDLPSDAFKPQFCEIMAVNLQSDRNPADSPNDLPG